MTKPESIHRRDFIHQSLVVTGTAGIVSTALGSTPEAEDVQTPTPAPDSADLLPCGTLGKARISRVMLGGNLIGGHMHCRDLHYVNDLFRAYATDEKIIETLKIAEENGINTVFETGGNFVDRYNRECGGHMQFIPHIEVNTSQTEQALSDHIKQQVDTGGVALYLWGTPADALVQAGQIKRIARAVEMAKKHGLPVGVGGHSLQTPIQCEQIGVPCDFYVKTLHSDDYPSATPKELRKDFMWLSGGKGWYDNMWCINPEETIAFMKSITKPWVAFKVLAAGAIPPFQAFPHAFKNGADFLAVGMLDFQIKANCEEARKALSHSQQRERPWRA
jgi:hypothetical protein